MTGQDGKISVNGERREVIDVKRKVWFLNRGWWALTSA
jgi:hypothetical protein